MKEAARVVAVDAEALWVEARAKEACQGCQARGVCGHRLLDSLHGERQSALKLHTGPHTPAFQPGDSLTLSMEGGLLVKLSLLFYCLPLAGLLAASLLANGLGAGEGLSIVSALGGLGGGLLAVRRVERRLGARALPLILPGSATPDREDITNT